MSVKNKEASELEINQLPVGLQFLSICLIGLALVIGLLPFLTPLYIGWSWWLVLLWTVTISIGIWSFKLGKRIVHLRRSDWWQALVLVGCVLYAVGFRVVQKYHELDALLEQMQLGRDRPLANFIFQILLFVLVCCVAGSLFFHRKKFNS